MIKLVTPRGWAAVNIDEGKYVVFIEKCGHLTKMRDGEKFGCPTCKET